MSDAPPLRRTRWQSRRRWAPYLFIAPAVLIIGCFNILPILFSCAIAFTQWEATEGLDAIRFAGLSNFSWVLFDDEWFGGALGGTLWSTLVGMVLVHSLAIPLAAYIDTRLRRWRTPLTMIYFLPYISSGIVLWFVMSALFSPNPGGVVNSLLNGLAGWDLFGFHPLSVLFPLEPVDWWGRHGRAIGVFSDIWHSLGWNLLLYLMALQYVPKDLYEAARMDGANAWQELRYITVPQLRPMIFFATTLSLVGGVQGGGPYGVAGYMYHMAYEGPGDFGATAAMGVILMPIIGALVWLLWAYVGGRPELPDSPRKREASRPERFIGRQFRRGAQLLVRALDAPPSSDPQHLRGFAGMRAIACLLVVFHHLAQRLDGEWALWWFFRPAWHFLLDADTGVSLFFVLSGALLAMPFWTRYLNGQPAPSLRHYALRRAARILPGYWVALTAAFVAGLILMPETQHALGRYLAGMGFVSALHYISFFPSDFNPVLWSISLEVLSYVLLPLLILPAWRLVPGRDPLRTLRYLAIVLIGLQIAHFVIIGAFMTDEVGKGWQFGQIGGAKEWLPYWNPATFMSQFLIGSIAAFVIAWHQQQGGKRGRDFDRLAAWALAVAAVIQFFFEFAGSPNTFTRQPYVTPLFPALCATALFAMHYGRTVHRVLDNRLFNFIATISFGLYLWHWPVLEVARLLWEPHFRYGGLRDFGHWAQLSSLCLGVSLMLAWLSWVVLERPALHGAQRWLARRKQARLALQAAG